MKKIFLHLAVVALLSGLSLTAPPHKADAQAYIPQYSVISRNLTIGSTGPDVAALQAYLALNGYLSFAPGYYDPITKAAVVRFQADHGIPSTGFFGPMSRGVYNRLITETSYPTFPTTQNCPAGFSPTTYQGLNVCVKRVDNNYTINGNDDNDDLEGDEATLRNFEVDAGDDTDLDEGDENAEVMEFSFDVEDGDIRVEDVDINFEFTGDNNAEDQPWETFEKATLFIDGDEVAQIDVDDEDQWDEEGSDTYQINFTNIDEIIREDDTAEFTLELDIQNNIDTDDDNSWSIYIPDDGIQVIDAENEDQEIGDEDEAITIEINGDNNSNGDSLTVSDSDENPDEMDIDVYEDDISDWETIFAFELSAEDQDITISELPLTIEFLDGGDYNDIIEDVEIEIDGDSYDNVDVDSNGDEATLTFDLDDLTIDEDDTVTLELRVRFTEADGNYDDNDQIRAFIDGNDVDNIVAEDEDGDELDSNDFSGSAEGETHTLIIND